MVDRGYHRELLATGVFAVYDHAFRWGDGDNGTIQLIEWAIGDGTISQLMLGLDAARQGHLGRSAGSPACPSCWVSSGDRMTERGIPASAMESMFVAAPSRAFAFAEVRG